MPTRSPTFGGSRILSPPTAHAYRIVTCPGMSKHATVHFGRRSWITPKRIMWWTFGVVSSGLNSVTWYAQPSSGSSIASHTYESVTSDGTSNGEKVRLSLNWVAPPPAVHTGSRVVVWSSVT